MLGQRLRLWPSISPELAESVVNQSSGGTVSLLRDVDFICVPADKSTQFYVPVKTLEWDLCQAMDPSINQSQGYVV